MRRAIISVFVGVLAILVIAAGVPQFPGMNIVSDLTVNGDVSPTSVTIGTTNVVGALAGKANTTGSFANWSGSGSTNSTLPGVANVNGLVVTNTTQSARLGLGMAADSTYPLAITGTHPYVVANGTWWSTPVVVYQPTESLGLAFDIMPKGAQAATWLDICSTDFEANSSNGEYLHLEDNASGAWIGPSKLGTGVVRDMYLSPYGGNMHIAGQDSAFSPWNFFPNLSAQGDQPAGNYITSAGTGGSLIIGLGKQNTNDTLVLGYYGNSAYRVALSVTNTGTLAGYSTMKLMPAGGYVMAGNVAFNGTSASFPMLTNSGTTLKARLADNTADAPFTASTVTLNAGSAASPSLAFPGSAGLYGPASGYLGLARNSTLIAGLDASDSSFHIYNDKDLALDASTGAGTVFLKRGGANATLQLGRDGSNVNGVDQTLQSAPGFGTDKTGGKLTIQSGNSTGTGAGGAVDIATSLSAESTGSTANSESLRAHYKSKYVALTHTTATTIETFSLAANKILGGEMIATCYATNSTPHLQALTSKVTFDAVAVSTTITGTISQVDNTTAADSGTLTCTYTIVDNGDNTFSIKANANSSLSSPTERAKVVVTALNGNAAITITDP